MNLLTLAPTILSFLGGPAGGLAGAALQFLAGKLGASDATAESIKSALDNFKPSDTIRLREIDVEFQKFCMENNIKIDLAQIDVNKEEAKSSSMWVAGWRPAVGWTCAASLAYVSLIEPFLRFIAQVIFKYTGQFPVVDTTITLQLLFALLGVASLRTFEKTKGTK
jgi:Holin of 3TMs, for gene-transfer release